MPIKPEDLYVAAQNLGRMKPPLVSDEVCARTMLNRMYYAAYLATREAVRAQLHDPSFDVVHKTLVSTLANAADSEVKDIGSRLRALKSARENADYQPQRTITRIAASFHLDHARHVLDNVARLAGRFPPIPVRGEHPERN